MSAGPDPEVLAFVKRTVDIVTVPVTDERLREIVNDESQPEEARRMAYELTSARTALRIQSQLDRLQKLKDGGQ